MGDLFHLPLAETQVRQLRVLGTAAKVANAPTIATTQTGGAGAGITIAGGAAIQLNSAGGDVILAPGANTGSGNLGAVVIPANNTVNMPGLRGSAGTVAGLSITANRVKLQAASNLYGFAVSDTSAVVGSGMRLGFDSNTSADVGGADTAFSRTIAGLIHANNGTAGTLRWFTDAGRAKITSQFDKTNDSTLADITGLSIACLSGRTYGFRAQLFVDANVTAGSKYAAAYSSTTSAIKFKINLLDDTTNTYTVTSRQTTSGGSAGQASTTAGECIIEGVFTTTGAGNLTIQFAQNVATPVTTSSVLTLSNLLVWDSN